MTTAVEIVNKIAAANTAIDLHLPVNYVQLDERYEGDRYSAVPIATWA
jgi:hypothetical protein